MEFTFETLPPLLSDRLMESFGGGAWTRRQIGKAMRRLRTILEEGRGRGPPAVGVGALSGPLITLPRP